MPVRLPIVPCLPVLLAALACGEPAGPAGEPVRTVLVHRQDTGENLLLNSDGSDAGAYAPGGGDLLPLGMSPEAQTLVLLDGTAIVIGSLSQAGLDTIIRPAPTDHTLATVSDDGLLVALVSFAPTRGLIVYDLANALADTLEFGTSNAVLPPVFSPDGGRVALFGLTPLSITITVVRLEDPPGYSSDVLATSRFINFPVFGWPRWTDDGIHMAFIRVADDGPDTLLVARVAPDAPQAGIEEEYRAVMVPVADGRPELEMGPLSTYALTADARALALGAVPEARATHHAIYVVTPSASRVQLVRDAPGQFLVGPLFVRR